jgi:predicted RecA/RadA family phage recombinase
MSKKIELLSAHYETIKLTASGALVGGALVLGGNVNAFTLVDVADTKDYAGVCKAENCLGEKATGAISSGAAVYWVNASSNLSTAGDILLGYANRDAASGDTHVYFSFDGYAAFLKL